MAIWDFLFKGKINEEVAKQVVEVEQRMLNISEAKVAEKAREIHALWLEDLSKATKEEAVEGKSLLYDPFQLMDTLKYKERPMMLTYEVLRAMSERNPIVASIINTRVNQIASFSQPPKTPYDIGFRIHLRDDKLEPTKADDSRIKELTTMIEETAISEVPGEERDSFDTFLRKITRDSLVYDQLAFEIINGKGGFPVAFLGIDAATIRLASTARFFKDIRGGMMMQPPKIDLATGTHQKTEVKPEDVRYVQVLDGKVVTTYTSQELGFGIRNPRSCIKNNGYGVSELELLVNTVTAHLWAEEYNRRFFSQGSAPKGIIHFEGNISQEQLNAFRRQWHAQVMGVFNSWRTPIVAAPAKLQYTNLQMSNKQMEFANWVDYLIKICCAIFLIDPSEIGFELRGGATPGQTPAFETHQEQRQKMSRDRGLRPLLKFIQHEINRNLIYRIDDGKYEFEFIGLDTKTEEQLQEMRIKEVNNFKTIDEIRAEYDLEPLGHDRGGDVIMNAAYLSYLNQLAMAKQQEQMAGGGGGFGGFGGEGGEGGGGEGEIPGEAEAEQEGGEGSLDFGEEEGEEESEGLDFGKE